MRRRVLIIENGLRNEKLGIMYLSASLKSKGHHADLIQADKNNLDEKIREYRPDFIAFSITTGEHQSALDTARYVKQRYGIPNIFGGPHCTFFPEIVCDPVVDFAVSGPGEKAIVDIVEGHVRPGLVKGCSVENPDGIPFPDRGIFYQFKEFHDNPMKNVITSRACPYRCSYCFNHSFLALTELEGNKKQWFRRRSVDNVIAEINEIRGKYPLEKILFIDDSFIQSRTWLEKFIDKYVQEIDLKWLCSLRVNRLNEALAEKLFKSGLVMINYALESADPDIQKYLLNRGTITNADIIKAIEIFSQYGVNSRMQNMIGLPLANPLEDAMNTLQFNIKHKVTDSWCSIFQPYPRTALGQYCLDHGFITDDQLSACSESFFHGTRLHLPNKKELYALQKLWYFIVEGDLPLDLVQTLIREDLTQEAGEKLQELRFACSRENLYGIGEKKIQEPSSMKSDPAHPKDSLENLDSETLIRKTLESAKLPKSFADIVSSLSLSAGGRRNIIRHLRGEKVWPSPLYTVDDVTGELNDPENSIWRRGGTGSDIRRMNPDRFMHGLYRIRSKELNS
jgi:anaerobic magnesium-protoporphyrin IX monomethyl ester cyclase